MFKESTIIFHTSLKIFCRKAQYGFVNQVLWQWQAASPILTAELIDVLRLGLKWLVAFKHGSPDMGVERAEVRRVRRPFIFNNEFIAVASNRYFSQLLPRVRTSRIVSIVSNIYIVIALEKTKIIYLKSRKYRRISPIQIKKFRYKNLLRVVEKLHFASLAILI